MTQPLRVGVIGLGGRWRSRYRPALRALTSRLQVRALCDQVQQRAELEAAQFGGDAVLSVSALLDSDDVEAVLLLDPQWYGLWPVEQLCRRGKPVYCGYSLEFDDAHADELVQKAAASRLPVMMEMLPRAAPVAGRLRELLADPFGPVRLLLCNYVHADQPVETAVQASSPVVPAFLGGMGVALIDWCMALMRGAPARVLGVGSSAADFGTVFLEYPDGRTVRVARHRAGGIRLSIQIQAAGAHGTAWARLPGRLRWTGADGEHLLRLAAPSSLERTCLELFADAVQQGQPFSPGLDDAYRALRILRAAVRSLAEEAWVELTPATSRG